MVLFKRKPVRFIEPPHVHDESAEVWHIPQTGEIFLTYEDYLNRMDFYKQSRFICQITGHSNLTFFEALQSELAGAEEVDQAFPESLKGPILRRVQFQTVSRIDHLVDMMFDEFKADYYPGESVGVQLDGGDRHQGVVREKAKFGPKVLADGTFTQPYSMYLVRVDNPPQEATVDSEHIWRDRKVFTKSVLRSFIKKTVTREAWNGAPWLVKHDVAAQYHIDTRVPPHLRYDNKLLERKQLLAQKKGIQPPTETNGTNSPSATKATEAATVNPFSASGPMRLPELKPAPKSHKAKHLQQPHQQPNHMGKAKQNGIIHHDHSVDYMQIPLVGNPFQFPVSFRNQILPPPPMYVQPEPPPPPPPPKYPIEDLQLEPQGRVRPRLGFLCNDPPVEAGESASISPLGEKILMKSVGPLLETWDTLNVYCEVFKLDSFTFESYVEALVVASEEVRPQLYDEIHCAVLSILVSSEKEGGKPQVPLPELDEDDEDEDEEEESREPTPEPQPQPTGRATRSSLAKLEAERLANEAAAAERELEEEAAVRHRAEDVLADYDWVEQLAKRNFQTGGWERIMVGLLHQLSKNERHQPSCEELLSHLVPVDVEPTQETIRQHYASLDVNHRVTALQIICMLTTDTKAVRAYMEECSETMTEYRKNKIEYQRQRKQAIEELKALNEERKILLPDNMPPSPKPETMAKVNGGVAKMGDGEDTSPAVEDETAAEADDDNSIIGRGLRRAQDRAAQRQRKRELEQERKKEAEAAAKVPKQSKQFLKVLKEIDKKEEEIRKCEAEIAVIDNDLREADCPRTRVLGKDRFWNRYYWFERNGMPYGGLPDSSTASAGYANGCIWVQGPDELEREGYIEMPADLQAEYKAKFGMTVPGRKKLEEGPSSLHNARQWGFISEPEDVTTLITWLDPRGFNELRLRKELVQYKDKIETHMRNRKAYLEPPEPPQEEPEKKSASGNAGSKRMSTRTRVVQTPEPPQPRCLEWENLTAINELGHLHSEHPPLPRVKKPSRKKEAADAAAAAAAAVVEKKKPLSRQGTRYNF